MHTNGGTLTKRDSVRSARTKLKDTTFILGDKPMKQLLWCNKVPKAKRNKPAKLNGILVTNTVEVFHEL